MLLADGFEDAIIGTAERAGMRDVAAYDAEKCIQILIDRGGMTSQEAHEFFEFNVLGSWVGEKTPVFVWVGDLDFDYEEDGDVCDV